MKTVHLLSPISVGIVVNLFNFVIMSEMDYMRSVPEPVTMLIDYETKISCQTRIKPDKFQWKFYPTDEPYNPKADINLSNSSFELLSESKYSSEKLESILTILARSTAEAGDYQCLAYYGAYVVASVPWRITIATLADFPPEKNTEVTVTVRNTVAWHCKPPTGNPEPYIDYQKGAQYVPPPFTQPTIKSLILSNVSVEDSGVYQCTASNMDKKTSNAVFKLNVVKKAEGRMPYFIIPPQKSYTVIKGSKAFLECSAVGNPVPKVIWYKKNSQLPSDRIEMVPGGLKISNISASDEDVYVCNFTNAYGMISHHINIIYHEEPSVECLLNNTDVKQGENLDLDCIVRGKPEPQISWFLNGFSVNNDSEIETIGNKIYFRPVEKRHAGNLQIFARNSVKTVYSNIDIKVIPLTTSIDVTYTHGYDYQKPHKKNGGTKRPSKHNKAPKMIPPNKPTISRFDDGSVTVRWSVPENSGLPIQFFKVQYKEVGSVNENEHHKGNKASRWKTSEKDIPPHIDSYDVTNLKPAHFYKFRVAAVYSNNDNKLSPMSKKFLLERLDFDMKNPLPTPRIIHTETVNSTSVKIYWECNIPSNVTIDGFYISYMSASTAGDYMKATADGSDTKSFVITHLTPETFYDIKIQSFNSTLASDFSPIMKAKTGVSPVPLLPSVTVMTTQPPTSSEVNNGFSKLYMMIAGGIVGIGLLVCGVILLFVCRKWQQKKTADNRDKPAVEDHHIQADSNDYVVNPKSISRANGHVLPVNKITITSNPLAEADNKNQAMIEMRNFTAQNNNVRQENNVASGSHSPESQEHPKHKKSEKTKRKMNVEASASSENYV